MTVERPPQGVIATLMSGRILVVDDDASILQVLSRSLRLKGFSVTTSQSVPAAEEILLGERFNLAILDVEIGSHSGLDLLAFSKRNRPEMPVIVFSGNHDSELPQIALASGAAAFLHKPVPMELIYTEVCRHLDG